VIQTLRQALRRWLVALIAVTVLAAGGAVAYSLTQAPQYQATTQLLVGPINADADSIKASQALIGTYAELVISPSAMSQAATAVGTGTTAAMVREGTDVQFSTTTRLLEVSVTLGSPDGAARAADTLANVLKNEVSRTQGATTGAGSLSTVIPATPDPEPVGTNPALRGTIAGLTAFVIGFLLVLLLEQTRGVIRTSEDVEMVVGRDALVEFPRRTKASGPVRHGDAPTTAAYRMLAAYLDTLPPRPGAHCVAVVGTGSDGRSQMPLNLSIALAQTGRRALLLENESEKPRSLAVFDTAPIDITGQAALYLFTPDPTGADFKVDRLGLTPETYQLALAWADSRSRAATEQAVHAVSPITDWVVLAPRSIEASDVGLSWAAAADAVFLVVEQGVTRRRELQTALVTLRRLTNEPIEVVLVPEGVKEGRSTKATLKAIQEEARAAAAKRAAKAAAQGLPTGRPQQPAGPPPSAGRSAAQPGQQPGQQSGHGAPAAALPSMPVVPSGANGQRPAQQPAAPAPSWQGAPPPGYRPSAPAPSGPVANPAGSPAGPAASNARPGEVVLPDAGREPVPSVVPPDSIFATVREAPAVAPAPAAQPAPSSDTEADLGDRSPWTGTFVPPPVIAPDQSNGRPKNGTPGRSR
jgi:capsular polysaccharide biosynthesis protein